MAIVDREYRYPGGREEYFRQATRFSLAATVFGALLLGVIYGVDRYLLGLPGLRSDRILLTVFLVAGASGLSFAMARSLASFSLETEDDGLVVIRGGSREKVEWSGITGLTRTKLPWFWPLRADLLDRRCTARHMWRLSRRRGPVVTFVSGLVDEEELLGRIRARAGLDIDKAE